MLNSPTPEPNTPSRADPLAELCDLYGIEPEFWDIWGTRHIPAEEVRKAILASLGVDTSSASALEESLRQRRLSHWTTMLPKTVVVSHGRPYSLAIRLPERYLGARFQAELHLEDGTVHHAELDVANWTTTSRAAVSGQVFVERLGVWPFQPPMGYHRIRLSAILPDLAARADARLIAAPDRAWLPEGLERGGKTAGVAVSLYGVRSHRNWGCGDITDLSDLIDWLAEDIEGSFLALNPLHAIENRQPYNISPYLPNSTFWRNPLYIDVERVTEFQESRAATSCFATPEIREQIESLRQAEYVEYEQAWDLKLRALKACFREFLRKRRSGYPVDRTRIDDYERFVRDGGERLQRFALYCALWEWLHKRYPDVWVWPEWPEPYRDPGSEAVANFSRRHSIRIEFYIYLQWLIDQQLAEVQEKARKRGLPIGLYHDLALAVDKCGADLWAYRDHFVSGCRVGSPPDGFAPDGQDWAFPPPHKQHHAESGYQLFIDAIRANSRHGGALRIDHVMRLFRLYWIPDGFPAKQGAYVRDNFEDYLRILALESHRGQFLIVGEDLGTVEHSMREALDQFGILSYKVLYFEKDHSSGRMRRPDEYARQALVASTTHDLPTLAGFWTNRDIEARKAAGLLPDEASYLRQLDERRQDRQLLLNALHEQGLLPEWFPRDASAVAELSGELHNAIIGFLVSTPSMLMVLNQEDLTKETEQQNLPASTWQYPNWRRKMRYSVEELRTLKIPQDFAAMFRNWLGKTGRSLRQTRT
jgi:4-alpha-glucanotransferase